MDLAFFDRAMDTRLRHLEPRSSPSDRVRNQLITVFSVFAVGATVRLLDFSWVVTGIVGLSGGLALGMLVLELYERATGVERAAPRSDSQLHASVEALMASLAGTVPEPVRGVWSTEGGSRTAGRRWTLTLRTDLGDDSSEVGTALREAKDPAVVSARDKPALPVEGARYPARSTGGPIPVLVGAWLQVDVAAKEGTSPPADSTLAVSVRGPVDAVLTALDAAAPGLSPKGRAAARKALSFNEPWSHQFRYEDGHLVVWMPLTDACSVSRVRRLIDGMGELHAALAQVEPRTP